MNLQHWLRELDAEDSRPVTTPLSGPARIAEQLCYVVVCEWNPCTKAGVLRLTDRGRTYAAQLPLFSSEAGQ